MRYEDSIAPYLRVRIDVAHQAVKDALQAYSTAMREVEFEDWVFQPDQESEG